MKEVQFGQTSLQVSQIGFGCARLGGLLQQTTPRESMAVLRSAYDQGITFYDTADMYSQGESERLVGTAFRTCRDKVVIASKGGYCLPAQRRLAATIKPVLKAVANRLGIERKHLPVGLTGCLKQDFSPDYLIHAIEGSLKRLGTDYLDLYQLHSPPGDVLRSGEFIEVLEKMKEQGKIRYYGVSCETAEDALLCLQYPEIASLQIGVGLLDQEAIDAVIPVAGKAGKAIIARGCLGGGLLKTVEISKDAKEQHPKWQLIEECQRLAQLYNRPLLETALQFVLGIDGVTVTLLGMRTMEHLAQNLQYTEARALSASERNQLRVLVSDLPVSTQ